MASIRVSIQLQFTYWPFWFMFEQDFFSSSKLLLHGVSFEYIFGMKKMHCDIFCKNYVGGGVFTYTLEKKCTFIEFRWFFTPKKLYFV